MQNPYKIGSIEYDDWNYQHPSEARDVVGEAKGSLSRANQLSQETDSGRLANIPASLAALRRPDDTRGPVRRITEPLAEGGNAAMLAGLPAGAVNPVIGGGMMAAGGLATLPDYLRKMIAPEGDEERPGVVESGMAGLAMLPMAGSVRGLRALSAAGPELEPGAELAREVVNTAKGYRAEGQSMRQAGQRAGFPLGKSAEVPYREMAEQPIQPGQLFPYQSEHMQSLRGLPQQGPQSFADAVRSESSRVKSPFEQMASEGAFGGDRTLRGVSALEEEGPSGLSAVAAGRIKPNVMPSEQKLAELSRAKKLEETYLRSVRSGGRYGPNSNPIPLPGVR